MQSGTRSIERNIWLLWLQGFDSAPDLVRVCSESWARENPGWRVHLLSRDRLGEHLDEDFARDLFALGLPPQKTANLIRLYLISRHGGVWADADCYCARPLDDWLPEAAENGFFAFRFDADAWLEENKGRIVSRLSGRSLDRVLGNWFLAGCAGNEVSSSFLKHHFDLFKRADFLRRRPRKTVLRLAMSACRRNAYLATTLANPTLLRVAGTFPYFVFHYHFARLLLADEDFRSAWRRVPKADARIPLSYSQSLHLPADEKFEDDITGRGSAPVYKFHHRHEGASIPGSRYRAVLDLRAPR
jgi:hypothetical protein